MLTKDHKTVGDYWSTRARSTGNWWTNRMVVRDINRRVIGTPHLEVSRGATELGGQLTAGRPRTLGVSVGCGNGIKEIALVRDGFVARMLCYDLAETRIAQARARAEQFGVADRIEFHVADAFALHAAPAFDFVYWNNALHHMFDVPAALAWSRAVLHPGGLLLVDEYVGASRMRFSDETLDYANAVRGLLPERILPADRREGEHLLSREWFAKRIARDPSEAVDAGRTLHAIAELFDAPVIRPTGGAVYFVALNGLFGNFDMAAPEDRTLLAHLLRLDAFHAAARPAETIYAVAAAIR